MNTYSLKAHLAQLSNGNPAHIYTFICECGECSGKQWVKAYTAQIPSVALKMGYSDNITIRQWENLIHQVVQAKG